MINGMENKFTGIFLCLIPPLIWGGMFPIANHLSATVNMFMMTLVRYSIVALVLTITLLLLSGFSSFRFEGHGVKLFILGAAGFAGFGLLAFTALSYTSSQNVSLLMATMPMIGALMASVASRALPPWYTVAAILVAFFGVSLVLTDGDYTNVLSGDDLVGEALALSGAVCWVYYTRGTATVPHWSILRYTTITTILGVPSIAFCTWLATVVGYVNSPSLSQVLEGWKELAYLVLLAGVVAVLSWNKGNRVLGPINGTLFMNLVPITTFTIVSLASGTVPSGYAIMGVLCVVGGLVFNNLCMRKASRVN